MERVRPIQKPIAWILGVLLAITGMLVTAPAAVAAAPGTINAFHLEQVYDGTQVPNALDDSAQNGKVATNDAVGYSWDLNVTDAQDATITQTLPEGWEWDPESFATIDTDNENYRASYVLSDDGRTVTATFSTTEITNNPTAISLGVLIAVPTETVPNGSVYSPEASITLGDNTLQSQGPPVEVLSQPTIVLKKGRNSQNVEGQFNFGNGPEAGRYIEYRIQITDVDDVLGARDTPLAQPAVLRDSFELSGPPEFLGSTFVPEVVGTSEAGGTVTLVPVPNEPNAVDLKFDGFSSLYGAWVDVRFWVKDSEVPENSQGLLKMTNTVNSNGVTDTNGDPAYAVTNENRADGVVVGSPNGGPGDLDGGWTGKDIWGLVAGEEMPSVLNFDPRSSQMPFSDVSGGVVAPGAIVTSRLYRASQNYAGTNIVSPMRDIVVYDYWDPAEQQLIETTAPFVGWEDNGGPADPANYVIEYTNGTDRNQDPAENQNVWYASVADAGGVTQISGIRVRYLEEWNGNVPGKSQWFMFVVPHKIVATEPIVIIDYGQWTFTDVNDNHQRQQLSQFVSSGGYTLAIGKSVDKSSVVSGATLQFEVRPEVRRAFGSEIDVSVQGLTVVDHLSAGIAEVDLTSIDPVWIVESEQHTDDGIAITFRYDGEAQTGDSLPPIRYSAKTSGLAPPSSTFQNTAVVSADHNAQPEDRRTARTDTRITQAQVVSEEKRVHGDNLLDVNAPQAAWQTSWFNFQSNSQGESYFVDALPYDGDDNGTSISGTATFASALLLDGDGNPALPSYGKLQYTTEDVDTVKASTQNPSVQITWVDAAAFDPSEYATITAVRAVVYDFKTGPAGVGAMRITLDLEGMRGGDKMVNVSSGWLGVSGWLGETNEAQIDIVAASVSGVVWHDLDGSGVQAPDDPLISGATVTLHTANGTQIAQTTTNTAGAYEFTELPAGDYIVRVNEQTLGFSDQAEIINTYDLDGDHNSDSGVITITKGEHYPTSVDFGYTAIEPNPNLEILKVSEPVSGSTVVPGQRITYTVTGANTGDTELKPVVITDDLSGIWPDVIYQNDAVATINGMPAAPPIINNVDHSATWQGTLQPGETVTIRFSVIVASDFEDTVLRNVVSGTGQPPWETPPLTPPPSVTEHYIPAFTLEKTSDPEDHEPVEPGHTITYTLTGTNTGGTVLDPVTILDDLSGLFDEQGNSLVAFTGSPVATINNPPGTAADPVLTLLPGDNTLTWTGALQPGQSVTITYTVMVLDSARGHELENSVTATAQPPGPGDPLEPPPGKTEHPVPFPHFELDKTSDPEDRSVVLPGDIITYTLTGINDGDTELSEVVITDNLEGVAPWVTYQDDATATINYVAAGTLTVHFDDPKQLVWTGVLQPGETVLITYSVMVNQNAVGMLIENVVTGSAKPPNTEVPIVPPPVDTEHRVPMPGFTLEKSVNPASGTAVVPGDLLRYQIVGTNTGETLLNPVVIDDDLSGINQHTELVGEPLATIDGELAAGHLDVNFATGTLKWTGKLEPGQSVVITYTVVVKDSAVGHVLENEVVGSAIPPGPDAPPITPTPPPTNNPVAGFTLVKSSEPESGTAVMPGETIEYTLTGVNTGATPLDPVVITDDVSGLNEWATYNPGAEVLINGEPDTEGTLVADYEGGTLTWTGSLQPDDTVEVKFSVTVKESAAGQILNNEVTGSATPPGKPPLVPEVPGVEHPVPGFELAKTSDPVSGTAVHPGDTITYTLTGENTGATDFPEATITDDLSGLAEWVTDNDDAFATIDGETEAGELEISFGADPQIVWTGALAAGEQVTITFSVTVNTDAPGQLLRNEVTGSATPPGKTPIEPEVPGTEHPVPTPGFTLVKTADPESGTEVLAEQTITYTLTGTNTGETVLDPVEFTDDLSGLWEYVTYNDDAFATIDGENPAGTITVDFAESHTLTWEGRLGVGEAVTLQFSVTVNENAYGTTLRNELTGSGQPPGPDAPPIEPEVPGTEHPVPGFELEKTSDPASGATVLPGQTIRYTVTGTNTGEATLSPVTITDDLSGVWGSVTYNNDAVAMIGEQPAGPVSVDAGAKTASWTGSLQAGETVTITYSVTVDRDYASTYLHNRVSGTAKPPGDAPPIIPPESETEHYIPAFTLEKIAKPVDRSPVEPGDTIEYTVTGTNTGATVLDPVEISDDLSGLFDAEGTALVTYNGDATAVLSEPAGDAPEPVVDFVDAKTLTWSGVLQPGQSVTLTYSVTVLPGAMGYRLENVVTASAQPPGPGVPPLIPPEQETEHPVPHPSFELNKTANPAGDTQVHPGGIITYTLTGENTGETVLDPIVITDDVSGLIGSVENPWVTYNADAQVVTHGVAGAGTLQDEFLSEQQIVWTGGLRPGETVTITYSVTVNQGAVGNTLLNEVTGSAQPPGRDVPPIIPPPVDQEHPVPVPGFELEKSVNPASGSTVVPGEQLRYQIVGTNTGDTILEPVTITDDLTGLNEHTTLVGQPFATIDGEWTAGDLVVDFEAGTMVWTGVLNPGESVVITYTVEVNESASGETLRNSVVGSAQPPGPDSPPIQPTPPPTENPVAGFSLVKTALPQSGTAVMPGQQVAYSLIGVNTGATVLDPVVITDDVSGLQDWVTYNNDAVALVNDVPDANPDALVVDFAAGTITWSGVLQPGDRVVLWFSVTVNDNATGQVLENTVSGSATPPGKPPLVPEVPGVEHPVAGFELVKASNPETGTAVVSGDTITYTLTGSNTGATVLDPVTITDDLSGLTGLVTYNDDAVATVTGAESEGALSVDVTGAQQLVWEGPLSVGETVTITYSVTVNADATGRLLQNSVTGSAHPPGPDVPPIQPTPPPTEHPVAGFEMAKLADPPHGSAVHPDQVITYTVTGTNTGATVLDPVTLTDNLSGLTGYTTYNDDASATIDGVNHAGQLDVQFDAGSLTWVGALQPGETVTITYSVTVARNAVGVLLGNSVHGSAQPPGPVPPIVPERPETVHPVPIPGFAVAKSANPAAGSTVQPGQRITYTVTGTNTGETTLDPVVITDDLAGVLAHSTYTGDVVATIDGAPSGEVIVDPLANEMVWRGTLAAGEVVTITYSVTVHSDTGGVTIRNSVVGTAHPPGGHPPIDTSRVVVEHPVVPQLVTTGAQTQTLWFMTGALLLLAAGLIVGGARMRRAEQ